MTRLEPTDHAGSGESCSPLPSSPMTENLVVSVPQRSRILSEKSDDYPRVVVTEDRRRVIECRHGIQWIIQARSGNKWRSHSYCRQGATLLRLCSDWSAGKLDALRALPEWIEEAR